MAFDFAQAEKKLDMKKTAEKAQNVGRWAKIMIKWALRFTSKNKRWQIVSFEGPKKMESAGIVDLIAIRRDYNKPIQSPLKPGDLFEIIFIQVKGGSAPEPSAEDKKRLLSVSDYYGAKHVVLAEWKKGKSPIFKTLSKDLKWELVDPADIFK